MKDYEYIAQSSRQRRDYFLATGERDVDRFVTDCVICQTVGDHKNLNLHKDPENQDDDLIPSQPWDKGRQIGDTRDRISFRDLLARFVMGAIGAAMLLGPMWIMMRVKKWQPYTSLTTTTLCVATFCVGAIFFLEKPFDVLSATAAYAAFLVVLVSLNT